MMESSELLRRKIKQNRRKERAERVEQERGGNDADDDTASPPLKKPRRKPRKSDAEEDVIDGFAIAAFRKYEDLTKAIKAEEEKKTKNVVSVLQGSQQDGVDTKIRDKPKKPKKPKLENNNTAITTPIQPFKVMCDRDDIGDSKISDGCSDLFAPLRKDSPGRLSDNLTTAPSAHEPPTNGLEKSEPNAPTSSITSLVDDNKISSSKFETTEYNKQYCKNGISDGVGKPQDLNGHIRPPGIVSNSDSLAVVVDKPRKTVGPTTLFTPYAATAITRVGTPNTSTTNQSITSESLTESPSPTSSLFSSSLANSRPSSSGLSHCTSNSTLSTRFEPTQAITTQPRNLSSPVVALEKVLGKPNKPLSPAPVGGGGVRQATSTTPSSTKSSAFGSIAKLLDTPNTQSSSVIGLSSVNSTSYSQSSQSIYQNGTGVPGSTVNQSNHCSSRSHSPRGHSPSRERDSYSSNVSSLSRTSGTPVSSAAHLPISPLQCLQSYSKAASWLNSTVSGISPLPRRTPPPIASSSGLTAHPLSSSAAASLPSQGATSVVVPAKPPSVPGYPGLNQGTSHALSLSTSNSAAMFAPPILPLSSIAPHPNTHSSYGMAESLFPGSTSTSELVRRDLESRLQMPSDRSSSMGTMYLPRSGEMPHSALLTPMPGVGQMQSPSSSSQNSVPTLFPPPLYKDMPKLGVDSPYFRSGLPLGYPGFNGMLPPSLSNTPFSAPTPSQVAAFAPKAPESSKPARSPKSGKWNAMHVRIAWEIYQDQQKSSDSKSRNVPPLKNSTSTSNSTNISSPATSTPAPTSSSAPTDLLRTPSSLLAGLGRPPEHLGQFPSPYSNPMLGSSGAQLRPPMDSSMFLNPLGAHMQRYPGFPSLVPPFGGLGGLSSAMLGRDLSSLSPLGAHSDPQWHRNSRPPSYAPPSTPLPPGWPMPRPDMDRKSPMDHRRAKEERHEKRPESRADPGRRSRDLSPFRDRSPVRPPRTPMENGDCDSRSSRSNDSHGAVHLAKSSVRPKEESNGDIERIMTPMSDRDKLLQLQVDHKNAAMLSAAHASRLYHHAGSQMAGPPSSWDAFASRMPPGMDPFRFNMQQFSERERELHQRLQAAASMRPPLYGNGPYGPLPLGLGQAGGLGKGGPPGHLSLPLLQSLAAHGHLIHASLNGQNSPKLDSMNPILRAKDES